jgi:hypothetical protein
VGFIFVASYDSHGYGGGIRTRLHMGQLTTEREREREREREKRLVVRDITLGKGGKKLCLRF